MKKSFSILFMAFALNSGFTQHHEKNTNGQVSSRIIFQQLLPSPEFDDCEIKMLIVDFPPGSNSSAHRHPCPTFGYMLEGEIESVFEGHTYRYKKGDTFYEPANGLHNAARNIHPKDTARLLVFFIAEKDRPTSIPER